MPAASLPVQLSNLASRLFQDHIGAVITGIIILIVITVLATNWITKVNASRSTLAEFIKEIRDDIKKIFDRLPAPTVASQSPIRLTDLGREIAEEIKVSEWVSECADGLQGRIESKSAYDIQEFCFQYAQNELIEDLGKTVTDSTELQSALFPAVEDIKLSAYNHGLELKQVLEVVGVMLRDEMLKRSGTEIPPD